LAPGRALDHQSREEASIMAQSTYEDPRDQLDSTERALVEQIRQRIAAGVSPIVYASVFATVDVLLAAVHINTAVFDLPRLLGATDGEFWHDIGGILHHARLPEGSFALPFSPRCARAPD
jgi:hypothetical protein